MELFVKSVTLDGNQVLVSYNTMISWIVSSIWFLDLRMRRIGFVYDERMLAHECIWVPSFPEAPRRLRTAMDRVREYGLLDRCVLIPVSYFSNSFNRDIDTRLLY